MSAIDLDLDAIEEKARIATAPPDEEDPPVCGECAADFSVPDDLEPTALCNGCAQRSSEDLGRHTLALCGALRHERDVNATGRAAIRALLIATVGRCWHGAPTGRHDEAERCTAPAVYGGYGVVYQYEYVGSKNLTNYAFLGWRCAAHRRPEDLYLIGEHTEQALRALGEMS